MSDVMDKLLTKILSETTITNIVSDRVYPLFAPADTIIDTETNLIDPFVVYRQSSMDIADNSMSNAQPNTYTYGIEITSYAATYDAVRDLCDVIAAAITDWSDTSTNPKIDSMRITGQRDILIPPRDGSDNPIYSVAQDYTAWIELS